MIRSAWRRILQGLRALTSFARPADTSLAEATLSPELMALFRRMRRSEQQHSLRMALDLRAQGHTHPDLLIAALLHDVGKSRYSFRLFERMLVVLAKKLIPSRYTAWSQGEPRGWRRPFVIAEQHPRWSAEDMAGAGASMLAISLVRRHQEAVEGVPKGKEDRLLALLQAVDNVN